MASSLAALFGFDASARSARLKLLQLVEEDHAWARRLQERVIAPHVDEIVDGHYGLMTESVEFVKIVQQRTSLDRLKELQRGYLLTLGADFGGEDYFEGRLRIGVAHVRARVPLGLYAVAYRSLTQNILDRVPAEGWAEEVRAFLLKITALDMSLTIETYHRAEVDALRESLSSARAAERVERDRARRDSLTGLGNRIVLDEALEVSIERSRAEQRPLCVAMVDIDHFKRINDREGHVTGDEILRSTAARVQSIVRASDLVVRYGGEEFLVILTGTALERAQTVCERMRQKVAASPIEVGDASVPVTVSIGVAELGPTEDAATVIERADEAMYRAKRAGRNRVEAARDLGSGEASLA